MTKTGDASVASLDEEDSKLAADLIDRVLTSLNTSDALLQALVETETKPRIAVSVFEAVAGFTLLKNYWIYYRISRAYFLIGRDDACFLTAVSAVQMEPTYPNWHMFENMFRYFRSRGRYRDAVNIARHQIAHTPEIPIVDPNELRDVMSRARMTLENRPEISGTRIHHHLHDESIFTLRVAGTYGVGGAASTCLALDRFAGAIPRPKVVVSELEHAKVIIFDGNILIFDENEVLQADISVCQFPEVLASKILKPDMYAGLDQDDVRVAVVISDKFSTANVCHFLFDHTTRLALYEPFCSLGTAAVIGPALVTEYQNSIVSRLGLADYRGTSGRYIIRAERLLVSHTCKAQFYHPAHLAAPWAIDFLRSRFQFRLEASSSQRIYISRRDASVRFIRNEADVVTSLAKYGFTSIALSELGYDEQVALFANATHVVGMHGAGLTNMVFCQPHAHVLEICHPVSGTAAYAVVGSVLESSYCAFIGRDAESDEAIYNDPEAAQAGLGMGGVVVASNRDVIVDLAELDRWLRDTGATS